MRYLDAKADRLVNVPDQISRQLQKDIFEKKSSDPKLFKKAEEDVLNLMTDNIYPSFIKAQSSPSSDSTSTVVPIRCEARQPLHHLLTAWTSNASAIKPAYNMQVN